MDNRVLFIAPRSAFLDSDRVFPPLGILYLKGVLNEAGVYSEIEDGFDFRNIEKYRDFSHICISCVTPQKSEAETILKEVKELFPSKKVIIGGPHAVFYTDDCATLDYDHIVVGDGEKSILSILSEKTERIINKNLSAPEMNLMPLPFRSDDFLSKYQYSLNGLKTTTMITSRGCPFNCGFCEHAKTKVRYYNPARIEKELAQITELGYEAVMFFDDLFAVNQKRVDSLCEVIKPLGIKFRCFGHVKCMTPKIAESLAKAGCVETGVGMESGSQKILDLVKFPTPIIEESYKYIKICHSFGIRVKAFFMLGLPGETKETIKETEIFIANSGIDDFDLAIYYPYKGTRIRDRIDEYDLFFNEGDAVGYYKGKLGNAEAVVRTSALSAEEIKDEKEKIFKRYKRK
jgi:radical SAM superfamily enzyme YgiQ (UPF0313 family)